MRGINRRHMLASLSLALPAPVLAQPPWPTRALRMVVPFAPGGALDALARILAPKMAEVLGLPNFETSLWSLLAVRRDTPAPLVAALHAAARQALEAADFQVELRAAGIEPAPVMSPEEVRAYVRAEQAKWRPIVEATGVRME